MNINGKVGGGELTQTGSHSSKGNVRSSQVTRNVFTACQEEAAGQSDCANLLNSRVGSSDLAGAPCPISLSLL